MGLRLGDMSKEESSAYLRDLAGDCGSMFPSAGCRLVYMRCICGVAYVVVLSIAFMLLCSQASKSNTLKCLQFGGEVSPPLITCTARCTHEARVKTTGDGCDKNVMYDECKESPQESM
jgi:hypothetical protein